MYTSQTEVWLHWMEQIKHSVHIFIFFIFFYFYFYDFIFIFKNPRLITLDRRHITLDPRLCTLDPRPSTKTQTPVFLVYSRTRIPLRNRSLMIL